MDKTDERFGHKLVNERLVLLLMLCLWNLVSIPKYKFDEKLQLWISRDFERERERERKRKKMRDKERKRKSERERVRERVKVKVR